MVIGGIGLEQVEKGAEADLDASIGDSVKVRAENVGGGKRGED